MSISTTMSPIPHHAFLTISECDINVLMERHGRLFGSSPTISSSKIKRHGGISRPAASRSNVSSVTDFFAVSIADM